MAKISHFVVTYNHETKEWQLDSESHQVLGGAVFDTVSEEWSDPTMDTPEGQVDSHAASVLYDAIQQLSG